MKYVLLLFSVTGLAHGATTVVSPNVYALDASTSITIGNSGASDYLFNWNDGVAYTNIADPSFIFTAGQTYTFARTSSAHPFIITDNTLGVSGSDGSFARTSTNSSTINATILSPAADFTADPAPTSDVISWTPTTNGTYYYTCQVAGHVGMTGKITVIPEPSSTLLAGLAGLSLLARRKRA